MRAVSVFLFLVLGIGFLPDLSNFGFSQTQTQAPTNQSNFGQTQQETGGGADSSESPTNKRGFFYMGAYFPYAITLAYQFAGDFEISYDRALAGDYRSDNVNLFYDNQDLYDLGTPSEQLEKVSNTDIFSIGYFFSESGFVSVGYITQKQEENETFFPRKTYSLVGSDRRSINIEAYLKSLASPVFGIGYRKFFLDHLGIKILFLTTFRGRELDREKTEISAIPALTAANTEKLLDKIEKTYQDRIYYRLFIGVLFRF